MALKGMAQIKNPRTGRYVKIDRSIGKIVSSKKTPKPYKKVPIISTKDATQESQKPEKEGRQ